MGRSIRSSRGKELRRIQREKLAHWDTARIQKLSNALAKTSEHVKYLDNDGVEKTLNNEQQQNLAKELSDNASTMDISDPKVEKQELDTTPTNKIIKSGIPKRKKRKAGKYTSGKRKKKGRK